MRAVRGWLLVLGGAVGPETGCADDATRDIESEQIPDLVGGRCSDVDPTPVATLGAGGFLPEAGSLLAVEGRPAPSIVCDAAACDTCCGACQADARCPYFLRSGGGLVCLRRDDFTCAGTECAPTCMPLSATPKRNYRFIGHVVADLPTVTVDVERFCRAP